MKPKHAKGVAHEELRADARANRAKILEAAQALFAERGASVPIDDIARRAGVGPGTLYRNFPNKEALFKSIVLERLEELVAEAKQLSHDSDPGAAFFSFLQRVVEEGAVKRDLVDALAEMGYDVKARTAHEMGLAHSAMARLLSRAQEAGAVRRDAKVADVFALITAVVRAGDSKGSDPDQRNRLLAILIDGLRG
ncbi:MAG TPA: helix-turn-helix domain-containing protein [Spirochaetia bacterium]|nr:helix-turn-helix domain-containing protein [Spirochaetia bacterium]